MNESYSRARRTAESLGSSASQPESDCRVGYRVPTHPGQQELEGPDCLTSLPGIRVDLGQVHSQHSLDLHPMAQWPSALLLQMLKLRSRVADRLAPGVGALLSQDSGFLTPNPLAFPSNCSHVGSERPLLPPGALHIPDAPHLKTWPGSQTSSV